MLTNYLSVLDHFVRLVLKGLYLLNTLIFMRSVTRNMYTWHVQAKFYQVVSAILLHSIGYLSCSLVLNILSMLPCLRFFWYIWEHIYIYIPRKLLYRICAIYICMYMCIYSICYVYYIDYIVYRIYSK